MIVHINNIIRRIKSTPDWSRLGWTWKYRRLDRAVRRLCWWMVMQKEAKESAITRNVSIFPARSCWTRSRSEFTASCTNDQLFSTCSAFAMSFISIFGTQQAALQQDGHRSQVRRQGTATWGQSQANIQTVAITAFQLYLNSTRRTMKSFCYSKKLGSYFHNIIIHQLYFFFSRGTLWWVERRNRFTKQVIWIWW